MMAIRIKIMVSAVKIRMRAGETLEEILESYTALTDEDRETIRKTIMTSIE